MRLAVAQRLTGQTMRLVGAVQETMADPRDTLFADTLRAGFSPGTYVFEFTRGSTVLAEGKLQITR